MRNTPRYAFIAVFALVFTVLGCVTTGPGGKTSFVLIPTQQEVAIGQGMAEEISQTEKRYADEEWQAYLNEVGQKIVKVCDRHDIEYHFTVIESDQINAFAAPGGFVYFYTGLLREMDNEAELAAVMAHEISHVVGRHGAKRVQVILGVSLAYELATGGEEQSQAIQAAVGIGLNLIFAGYSREHEREADDYGFTYMMRAGYDPHAMVTMFEKLAAHGGESNSFEKMLASHPETQERIAYTRAKLDKLPPSPQGLSLAPERYLQMRSRLPKGN